MSSADLIWLSLSGSPVLIAFGWYLLFFRPAEAQRELKNELKWMQRENNNRFQALESEIARLQKSSMQQARY